MLPFLSFLQSSPLGHVMRESGGWTYACVNLVHIIGIALLFGSVLLLDLRMLGLWRHVPLAPLATVAAPLTRTGFAIAVVSGLGLLSANATDYATNPFLLIKFPAIGLGALNALVLQRSAAWRTIPARPLAPHEERQLARFAGLSLACWTTAVTAGRMIGYW